MNGILNTMRDILLLSRGDLNKIKRDPKMARLETEENIIYRNLDLNHANILVMQGKKYSINVKCHFFAKRELKHLL